MSSSPGTGYAHRSRAGRVVAISLKNRRSLSQKRDCGFGSDDGAGRRAYRKRMVGFETVRVAVYQPTPSAKPLPTPKFRALEDHLGGSVLEIPPSASAAA